MLQTLQTACSRPPLDGPGAPGVMGHLGVQTVQQLVHTAHRGRQPGGRRLLRQPAEGPAAAAPRVVPALWDTSLWGHGSPGRPGPRRRPTPLQDPPPYRVKDQDVGVFQDIGRHHLSSSTDHITHNHPGLHRNTALQRTSFIFVTRTGSPVTIRQVRLHGGRGGSPGDRSL